MIKLYLAVLLILVSTAGSWAQEDGDYPLAVQGQGTFRVPAGQRFWVLKDSQYQKALEFAKNDSLSRAMEEVLREKIQLMGLMVSHKDSTIAFYRDGYHHYTALWKETDKELEAAEVKSSQRFSYFNVGFVLGVIAAGTVALVVN